MFDFLKLNKNKKKSKKKNENRVPEDPTAVMQKIIEGGFRSYRGIFKANLVRGIAFGFGSVLGATVLVALFAWLLSFFDNMFIVGDIIDSVQDSLNGN